MTNDRNTARTTYTHSTQTNKYRHMTYIKRYRNNERTNYRKKERPK